MVWKRRIPNRIATLAARMFGGEAGSGLLLITVAALAMALANSSLHHAYHALFHAPLGWTPIPKLATAHLWINDGLMALFFFVVGLEIKREVLDGELASPARRRLPVLAALAGMAVPAAVYLAITSGDSGALARGWAIPAATDIAFALGVLALLGKRLPPALRLFLLTVAIVDDLGAVAIIALFYASGISLGWLLAGGAALVAMVLAGRLGLRQGWIYALLGCAAWLCVLHSGVHATVAGVLAAFAIPIRLDARGDSLLLRMEHALVPWNGYVIVPLFGFANAGVALAGVGAGDHTLPLAVAAGLLLGKQAGIFGAIFLADRTGFAPRPKGATWLQVWGLAVLCGIGFTMSLFIGALAFPTAPALVDEAKLGVLGGSLASALLGYGLLRLSLRRRI